MTGILKTRPSGLLASSQFPGTDDPQRQQRQVRQVLLRESNLPASASPHTGPIVSPVVSQRPHIWLWDRASASRAHGLRVPSWAPGPLPAETEPVPHTGTSRAAPKMQALPPPPCRDVHAPLPSASSRPPTQVPTMSLCSRALAEHLPCHSPSCTSELRVHPPKAPSEINRLWAPFTFKPHYNRCKMFAPKDQIT